MTNQEKSSDCPDYLDNPPNLSIEIKLEHAINAQDCRACEHYRDDDWCEDCECDDDGLLWFEEIGDLVVFAERIKE